MPDFMPFQQVSDDDLTAIISYIRTVEPVNHKVETMEMNFLGDAIRAFVLEPAVPAETVSNNKPRNEDGMDEADVEIRRVMESMEAEHRQRMKQSDDEYRQGLRRINEQSERDRRRIAAQYPETDPFALVLQPSTLPSLPPISSQPSYVAPRYFPAPDPPISTPAPLGALNVSKYDENSLANPYGAGSRYKPDGLLNPYSENGSRYSDTSWNNPYATEAPKLYDADGNYRGRLSVNRYDEDSVSNPYGRYGSKYSPDSINNPYGAGSIYTAPPVFVYPAK